MYKKLFFIIVIFFLIGVCFASRYDYAFILKIDSYSIYPTEVYPNDFASITITLKNISEINDAYDINVIGHPNPNYFEYIKSEDHLKLIKFSQTSSVNLQFKIKPHTPGGYYSIPIKIYYKKKGETYDIDTQITIKVENYKSGNLVIESQPKTKVYLGETFEINGVVKNTGNISLKGVKVSIDLDNAKILSLNEITQSLGSIDVTKSKKFKFKFKIPKGATPGIYTLTLTANDFEENIDNEKIILVIEDKPSLIISSIDKSVVEGDVIKQNTHFSLSIQLENISKAKAKSVVIEIIDSTTNIEGTKLAYVGPIDADDSGAGVFDLYVPKNATPGSQKIVIKISYTDEYDKEYSYTKEISLYIEKQENSKSLFFGLSAAILIIIAIGYFILRKKQKKKVKEIM